MRSIYKTLGELNREQIVENNKRAGNFSALMGNLKEVNQMIQKAARLRGTYVRVITELVVGPAKQRIINSCRQALKAKNNTDLFQIIKTGKAG